MKSGSDVPNDGCSQVHMWCLQWALHPQSLLPVCSSSQGDFVHLILLPLRQTCSCITYIIVLMFKWNGFFPSQPSVIKLSSLLRANTLSGWWGWNLLVCLSLLTCPISPPYQCVVCPVLGLSHWQPCSPRRSSAYLPQLCSKYLHWWACHHPSGGTVGLPGPSHRLLPSEIV
jgi:hypothetical protein